jgi:hypothetical protein
MKFVNINRPAKYKEAPTQKSAAVAKGMAKLNAYSSTNPLASLMMEQIKKQYTSRDIPNVKTAMSAMESLKKNNFNDFSKKFETIANKIPVKQAKLKAKRDTKTAALDAQIAETITQVDRAVHRPNIKTKNWETEAPSSEIIFKKKLVSFEEAWAAGKNLLIKSVQQHMTKKQPNLKLYIGIQYTVIKQAVDHEDQDPEDLKLRKVGDPKPMAARTKPVNVYSVDSVKGTIMNLKKELETKFWKGLENQVGSNWAIDKITNLFANTHTLYAKKGSSYIPTPARYAAPKCGLINIRTTDQHCFKHCMKYYQSEQTKHSHDLTDLAKTEDKYDYGAMTFPASLDDIERFAEDNELTINIFQMGKDSEILNLQDGNVQHCINGIVNLLFIEEGGQAHFICIKKLEHLMRASTQKGYQDRRHCPYCRTGVWCKDETFEDHLMSKHFSTKNNCNLELPEEGATMKFNNYKDMLIRPFIVYADFEASLVKVHRTGGKTHKHVPNSAAFHFVCTHDSARNEYQQFTGPDCVVQLITKLQELSERCVDEMRMNQEMIISREDTKQFKDSKTCYICNEGFTDRNYKVRDHDHRTGQYRGGRPQPVQHHPLHEQISPHLLP